MLRRVDFPRAGGNHGAIFLGGTAFENLRAMIAMPSTSRDFGERRIQTVSVEGQKAKVAAEEMERGFFAAHHAHHLPHGLADAYEAIPVALGYVFHGGFEAVRVESLIAAITE